MKLHRLSSEAACLDSKHCLVPKRKESKYHFVFPATAIDIYYIDPYQHKHKRKFELVMTSLGRFYADLITGTLYHTETGLCLSGNHQRLILLKSQILPFVAAPANKQLSATPENIAQQVAASKTGSATSARRRSSKYIPKGAKHES